MSGNDKSRYFSGWWALLFTLLSLQLFPLPFTILINLLSYLMKDMTKNHFWVFGVLLNKQNKRDKVMEKLLDKKIETRPFFWPLHLQPALGDMYKSKVKKLKTSENLGKNGLYIPIGTHVSKQDQEFIIDSLLSIIESS